MILQLYKLYTLIFLCIVAVSCTSTTKPTKSTKVVTGFVYEFEGGIGPIPFAEVKVKGTERNEKL